MALVFVPLQNLALSGVELQDAGAASATLNSALQVGGSIGLSVFTALYASAVARYDGDATSGASQLAAFASGYSAAFLAAAIGMVLAAVIAAVFIRGSKEELLPPGGDSEAALPVH
jgi:hypothetical protein